MKTKTFTLITFAILGLCNTYSQVGIGTTEPDPSAALDIEATDKGLLPPRMTEDERNNISSPAQGLMIYCINCGTNGEAQVYNGTEWTNMTGAAAAEFVCGTSTVTFTYNGESVTYGTVLREYGGEVGSKCWLDRNLGASQVATSSTDADAYGDLFQWGRGDDGHQNRGSVETTSNTSDSSSPGTEFIIGSDNWYTGTDPNPDNLWKEDGTGVNNPCPSGFRVPTEEEWEAERLSWDSKDPDGAINSPLKLPVTGYRKYDNGDLGNSDTSGEYWSSTVSSANSNFLTIFSGAAYIANGFRASGLSVRCIKD